MAYDHEKNPGYKFVQSYADINFSSTESYFKHGTCGVTCKINRQYSCKQKYQIQSNNYEF